MCQKWTASSRVHRVDDLESSTTFRQAIQWSTRNLLRPRDWLTSVVFFDTILSGKLSLQEADKVVAADLMEQPRFSSVTLAEAEFVHNVSILLVLGLMGRSSDSMQTCLTKHWKRSGENHGLKTNPSVAGWQAWQCWCKCLVGLDAEESRRLSGGWTGEGKM